jgi:2-aminoethylphosphonate-pyruvate transaminase
MDHDIPYLLLTPGPLTTSRTVRRTMLRDLSTRDRDYKNTVQSVREGIVRLATTGQDYTAVLMQGSGTFAVEATLGSVIPPDGRILVVDNGAYGQRMAKIAKRLRVDCTIQTHLETEPVRLDEIRRTLQDDPTITHVAMVHCETTTGMLNPAVEVGHLCRDFGKIYILDAMSSFGGIPIRVEDLGVHYLISSANKCIQGVPGFGFVVAHRSSLEQTEGWARSFCLDLFDQWKTMERGEGDWRFTSPTHVILAFEQALQELSEEGGVTARHARYVDNHTRLVAGMGRIGFHTLLPGERQAPIITSFLYPMDSRFDFDTFFDKLKTRRFMIYPGKVTHADTFRIGNIGHVFPRDIDELIGNVSEVVEEMGIELTPIPVEPHS